MQTSMQSSIPKKILSATTGKRYSASYCIWFDPYKIDKIEDLLDKWNVEDALLKRLAPYGYFRVKFLTSDNRKIFAFKKIVKSMGGRVVQYNFQKRVPDNDVPLTVQP